MKETGFDLSLVVLPLCWTSNEPVGQASPPTHSDREPAEAKIVCYCVTNRCFCLETRICATKLGEISANGGLFCFVCLGGGEFLETLQKYIKHQH